MKRFLRRQELNPAFKRFQLLPQLRARSCCTAEVGYAGVSSVPSTIVARISESERQGGMKEGNEGSIALSS